MPFRPTVAEPEELAKLTEAFDAAWIAVDRVAQIEPLAQEAARERLGHILLDLWREDRSANLAARSVEAFMASGATLTVAELAQASDPHSAPTISGIGRGDPAP